MSSDNLGPSGPWQIKDIPIEVRKRIVADAAAQNLTVAEYLVRVFTGGHAPALRQSALDAPALLNLAQAAAAIASASDIPMPKAFARRLYRLVDDQARAAVGL